MRNCYFNTETRAIADLTNVGEMVPDTMTITRINVPKEHRSKGLGSELLDRICEDADAEGMSLSLEVVPSGGLDYDGLVAWYKRYGFEWSEYNYCMIRRPMTDG